MTGRPGPPNAGPGGIAVPHRFVALDSLRGICACLVVLFHFRTTGVISSLPLIRNGWLFVDFFFVLSGFVIAASYGDRLASGFPISRFMALRLGRVYPLHLAVLLFLLLLECAGLWWSVRHGGSGGRTYLTGPRSLDSFFANLALLQIFGLFPFLTWNSPSWSIAAEVWTYLIAALGFRYVRGPLIPVVILVILASLAALALTGDDYLNRTYSFALVRCLYGFGQGMLVWFFFRRFAAGWKLSPLALSIAEIIVVAIAVLGVSSFGRGPLTLICPSLFALAVLLFAKEGGAVSRLLTMAPFVFVGTLSYSIYMIHVTVLKRVADLGLLLNRLTHRQIVTANVDAGGVAWLHWAGPRAVSDLVLLASLGIVIGLSWITYRVIEKPSRDWSRNYARKRGTLRAETVAPSM